MLRSLRITPSTAGSGSVNNTDSVSLKEALEEEGYEVDSALWELLAAQKVDTASSTINEGTIKDEVVSEISLSQYESAASWSSAKAYSDYAIVTFGRAGSEGSDLSRGSDSKYSYLELGASEIALLEKLKAEGFTVITLINSSHVMELGPVIENSDAVLWIGGPGLTGLEGVARILSDKVSPSGRLVDTWMYEQETSSTYYTAQQYNYYLGNTSVGGYTNYNEGIYVGYKWYETADAEGYWDDVDNEYGTGYEGVVAYPFGYGLSYAALSERIDGVEYSGGTLTFTVTASNASDIPSKDVFELYVEKPYEMNEVNYLLLYKGDSDKGGPEASARCFVELDAAMKAMHDHHRKLAAALGMPFDPRTSSGPYTVLTKNGIRMDRHGDHFRWEIIKAIPEDTVPDAAAKGPDGVVLRVTGDRNIPLMSALLELYAEQPEMLNGLVEVIPSGGEPLCFSEARRFRPPYLKALNDISQLLQDNGYEAASKFLDCCFDL